MQKQLLDAQHLPPDQQEIVRQRVQATIDGIEASLTWDSIRPLYITIYADNFDEAELQGIIDYYKTLVRQKWLEKQPAVQNAKSQVLADIILKIQVAAYGAAKHPDEGAKPSPTATT